MNSRVKPFLLAACASACVAREPALPGRTPTSVADEPAPVLGATEETAAETVRYTLELVDPDEPLVVVHVEAPGDADGKSEFSLSEGWAGLAESGRDLELVEARGASDALGHERTHSYSWSVRHAPLEPLALAFELHATRHRAAGPPEYYLPILEPGLLHLLGAQALPAPEHLDSGTERPIELVWVGFAEAGWKVLSSFGTGDLALARDLDSFRHALFLAGELRLQRHEVHGEALWISVSGAWSFSDEDFGALTARIVALGREFFGDFALPYYLVSLIPVGAEGSSGSSYGGTGLSDSFALFVTRDVTLAHAPGGGGIPWLLAHELFHQWNGHVVTLAQPEQLAYWFSEGFTDFFARRLLQRAGLFDEGTYLASWNHKLAVQAANPERHARAERVREAFWTVQDVGDVPYQRGDLIALFVDHAIRARSRGERSLDDLMRELVRRARAGAEPLDNDALFAAIGELAGAEAQAAVRAWALEGVEPTLPADALGPEYELVAADVPLFDTGFDHETTLREGVVSGVRPGGCAERAGLEDGMRLAAWSVNFGQVNQPIEVSVRAGQETRKIAYLPHGTPVRGYRVEKHAR